jgi:hypothetical protein
MRPQVHRRALTSTRPCNRRDFQRRLLALLLTCFPRSRRRVARGPIPPEQFGDAYFAVHSVYRYPWAATVNPLTYLIAPEHIRADSANYR